MKDQTGQQPEPKREDATTIHRHCLFKQDRIRQSSDANGNGNIEQRICSGLKDLSRVITIADIIFAIRNLWLYGSVIGAQHPLHSESSPCGLPRGHLRPTHRKRTTVSRHCRYLRGMCPLHLANASNYSYCKKIMSARAS